MELGGAGTHVGGEVAAGELARRDGFSSSGPFRPAEEGGGMARRFRVGAVFASLTPPNGCPYDRHTRTKFNVPPKMGAFRSGKLGV